MNKKEAAEPLYVSRPVLNGDDIVKWAREQGLTSMLYPDDLHVTICYSKEPLVWDDVPKGEKKVKVKALSAFDEDDQPIRQMEMFGKEHNVLVLQIESDDLHARWQEFCDHGASYDFPEYKPHITITYNGNDLEIDYDEIEPYEGEIILGPEKFKKIEKQWAGDAKEIDLTEAEIRPFCKMSIAEKRETIPMKYGQTLPIWKNPSRNELIAGLSRSASNTLRGTAFPNGKMFVWDASSSDHWSVHDSLHNIGETEPGGGAKFMLGTNIDSILDETDWGGGVVFCSQDRLFFLLATPRICNHPMVKRLFGELKLVGFNEDGRLIDEEPLNEARSEVSNGIRVIINPNAYELAQLCDREEMRGVTDGKNVYVWPSYSAIHLEMMNSLGIDTSNYPSRFYAFIPDFGEDEREMRGRFDDFKIGLTTLPNGVVIAASNHAIQEMVKTSTANRWLNPRKAVSEAVEDVDGIRYYRNPSRAQFQALLSAHDLRGLVDVHSPNVFVWDAGKRLHFQAAKDLGLRTQHDDPISFYAHRQDSEGDWEWKHGEHGMGIHKKMNIGVDDNVVVTQSPRRDPVLGGDTTDVAMVRKNGTFMRMIGALGARPRSLELTEGTEDPLPKKFWLVFDIPTSTNLGDDDGSQMNARLAEIASGSLKGIRGISDTREIITDWWLMCRNAVAIMDPAAVSAVNDMHKIRYDDPEYLCKDNFAGLYRLWDKESRSGNANHHGMFQNLIQYTIACVKREDGYLGSMMGNNGLEWRAADVWKADPSGVTDLRSAIKKVYDILRQVIEDKAYYGFERIKEALTFDVVAHAVRAAIIYVGELYSSEGEWIIDGNEFHIPRNTILMLGIDPKIASEYPDWLKNKDNDFKYMMNSSSYERYHGLMQAIEKYNMRDHYVIRFVDAKKFEFMRGDVMGKRRVKRQK